MLSHTDIRLSSAVNIEPSLLPIMSDSTFSSNFTDEQLSTFDKFDDDINQLNMLSDSQLEDMLQGKIEGLNDAQSALFDENFLGLLDKPKTDSICNDQQSTKKCLEKPAVVKSSDMSTTNFIDSGTLVQTGYSLILSVAPSLRQRIRYEKELQKTLRYIYVPNNDSITLVVPNLRRSIGPEISVWARITHATIPHGPTNLILCHPYQLWSSDKEAKVHHGSLYIPVTDQNMNDECIKIDNLVMLRLNQNKLQEIEQLTVYTPTQIDFNTFHLTTTTKAKCIRDKYELRYSVLHFQIILVDQNNAAYPTDLQCQTMPIYGYEATELKNLPPTIGNIQKQTAKGKKYKVADNKKKYMTTIQNNRG